MGTAVSFTVYAIISLTAVFSPATGHVSATSQAGVSVTVVQSGNTVTTSAL